MTRQMTRQMTTRIFFFSAKLGAGINLERNLIQDSEILQKYRVGPDQLFDYLEKRMQCNIHIFFRDIFSKIFFFEDIFSKIFFFLEWHLIVVQNLISQWGPEFARHWCSAFAEAWQRQQVYVTPTLAQRDAKGAIGTTNRTTEKGVGCQSQCTKEVGQYCHPTRISQQDREMAICTWLHQTNRWGTSTCPRFKASEAGNAQFLFSFFCFCELRVD